MINKKFKMIKSKILKLSIIKLLKVVNYITKLDLVYKIFVVIQNLMISSLNILKVYNFIINIISLVYHHGLGIIHIITHHY